MRKLYILLFLSAIVSLGYSQDVRFGFTVTPTFGFANVDPFDGTNSENLLYSEDTESRTGIAYGILLDYDFNGEDRNFLHTGLTLHHTGFDVVTTGNSSAESQVKTDYIEIPLALKLKTKDIGYLRYYGQFGLNNGFKVGQKVKEGAENAATEFGGVNVGLNMGGGVEYTISDETIGVAGLYYNNGFSKVADNIAGTIKQSQLGIRLGVYF